ncbi:MAG: O-antigen ligase family protein [Patescibacteria group bacterium]
MVGIIKYGVYAALFLPLAVLPLFFFPFATTRAFGFQIIVEVVFALYILLAVRNSVYRPKKTLVWYALEVYFFVLTVSTLLSVDIYHSFFGNFERMWGLFSLLHFLLFFVVLVGIFRTREEWATLLKVALAGGAFAVAIGLFQFFMALFFAEGEIARIAGPIGNPAFFAAYLLFPMLFSLLFVPRWILRGTTVAAAALSFLALCTVLLTATRGALLAIASAVLAGTTLALVLVRNNIARIGAGIVLVAAVAGAGSLFAFGSLFEKPERQPLEAYFHVPDASAAAPAARTGFLQRLADFSLYDATTQTRLITWRSSLDAWKEYPLFGAGPENFILSFNRNFDPAFYSSEQYEIWFDRSHNQYIDTLVMTGAIGLAAYLFLFIACARAVFSLYRQRALDIRHVFVFTLFFVAYAAQDFFLFDSFAPFLMFLVALAYLNSFVPEVKEGVAAPAFTPSKIPGIALQSVAVALVPVLFLSYFFTYRPAMAAYGLSQAESGKYSLDAALGLYDRALSWKTYGDFEVRSRLALAVAREVQGKREEELSPERATAYLDAGIAALKENIDRSPKEYLLYRLQLSDLYNLKLSRTGLASPEIEDIVRESIALAPGRMEFEFALAQTEFLKGNFTEAIALLEQASVKNPEHPIPYWKIAQNYYFASQAESDPEKKAAVRAQGVPYFEKALWLGYDVRNYQEVLWAMEYYNDRKDYEKIMYLNKLVLSRNPPDAYSYHMNLAIAYKELGMNTQAREHAHAVGELEPSLREAVDNFLKELSL